MQGVYQKKINHMAKIKINNELGNKLIFDFLVVVRLLLQRRFPLREK